MQRIIANKISDIYNHFKLVSKNLADFYGAMTTNRSYKNAREPFQALEFMSQEKCRTELDQKVLRVLIMALAVRLNRSVLLLGFFL
jgi:HD-GYP domain-containing protein (c-di-GMP phosphodiesterase class II)